MDDVFFFTTLPHHCPHIHRPLSLLHISKTNYDESNNSRIRQSAVVILHHMHAYTHTHTHTHKHSLTATSLTSLTRTHSLPLHPPLITTRQRSLTHLLRPYASLSVLLSTPLHSSCSLHSHSKLSTSPTLFYSSSSLYSLSSTRP
jgi:hypothetical protein